MTAAILLLCFCLLAAGIWFRQNRTGAIGGNISMAKAAWFAYAVVLWIGVPLAFLGEHRAFGVLAISMCLRAALEIPLCLTGRWRVAYGVSHDILHALLTIVCFQWIPLGWVLLTLVSLATELLFVNWFKHSTGGPGEGIFFVPGGPCYRTINRNTIAILLPQFAYFLMVLFSAT